ncbi:polyphosphate kinase 1 [Neisseriaceae bacterium PsAf]|nr:polyphosphate kinase 1 [Neisseriaceae bacterium PsAf]
MNPNNSNILCRESSLLEFNRRVLAQALDESTPLLERLKFLSIVSSNLDEFFEVRIAALKRLDKLNPDSPLINGETPREILKNVRQKARILIDEQYKLLNDNIIPALRKEKIIFLKREEWTKEQSKWIEEYFNQQIKPIITPIGLDPAHPFPKLLNKSLNFIIELEGSDAFGRPTNLAVVQAPRILPRVVKLPEHLSNGADVFVFLSSIIHDRIQDVFLGMNVKGCYQFRLTRDSELIVDDDDLKDLLLAVQGELHERQYGKAVRLEVATNCPERLVKYLTKLFKLEDDEVYRVNGPVNLIRLIAVPDMINRPDLKFPPKIPSIPEIFKNEGSVFEIFREQDVLLHHPYQSFQPVVDFIQAASKDPKVVAIKMTIYRTGSNSDIIKALIAAALSGKEVTVVVELMARFDEEANVYWANKLEDAGAHVVYGVVGYKVHAKMILVVRKENNELRRYGHLGTGNYHQGTSKLYTDFGLLTADPDITADMNEIFIQITGLGHAGQLKKMYQSPFTLHQMLLDSIQREIENAQQGKPAKIMAKMNSLVEPQLIEALYEASQAGVEVDLIVRGICILKPQVPNLSENIRVRSIIGRLLEHSRVFYFYNNGVENTYISSADWMSRNMFGRVETCVPILNQEIKRRVINESFTIALKDNQRAWEMFGDGSYKRVPFDEKNDKTVNLHDELFSLLGSN